MSPDKAFKGMRVRLQVLALAGLLIQLGCASGGGVWGRGKARPSREAESKARPVPLEMGINELARGMLECLGPEEKPKVAVVDLLGPRGNHSELGAFISEKLITRLFLSGRFEKVLERRLLNHLIAQERIEMEAYFDQDTVGPACEKIGVDAIVMGVITDRGPTVDVNARLIDTRGEILSVAEVQIEKDPTVGRMLQAVEKATLTVIVDPPAGAALVALDGKVIRSANGIALFRSVPQGNRNLSVTAKGYEPVQESIYLNGDRTVKVHLVPKRVTVTLRVDPPGAQIVFDGEAKGEASQGVMILKDVPAGRHAVLVTSEGRIPEMREMEFHKDTTISIRLLSPSPSVGRGVPKADAAGENIRQVAPRSKEPGKRRTGTGIWEVEDDEGNRSTLYQVGGGEADAEAEKDGRDRRDRVQEMLRNLDVIIDGRRGY